MISSHAFLARDLLKEKSEWHNKVFIRVHSKHIARFSEEENEAIKVTILEKLNNIEYQAKAVKTIEIKKS